MFRSPIDFSLYIEEMVRVKRVEYHEAVLIYCNDNKLEPSDIAKLISPALKEKIQLEFEEINMLPKTARIEGL